MSKLTFSSNHAALVATFVLTLLGTAPCASAQTYGIVPSYSTGNYYPSISADGNRIAFLTDISGGGSTIKVYDRALGTTTPLSSGVPYCSRPRISRDGKLVAFFGTPFAYPNDKMVVPIVMSATTGSWVAALDLNGPSEPNTTMIWDVYNPPYAMQAPGITNEPSDAWTVSFGDLNARNGLSGPDGDEPANEWICTSSTANGDASHIYLVPGGGVIANQTDISADGSKIAFNHNGVIYAINSSGTVLQTASAAACQWPSIDGAGAKVAFEANPTGGVLSGADVYILNVSTGAVAIPYTLQTSMSSAGSATHPFISSDGGTVAFNTSSKFLTGTASANFTGFSGTFAAQCATTASASVSVLSLGYTGANYVVKEASDACAYDLGSQAVSGAFASGATGFSPIGWGTLGTGSNVLKAY